MREMFQRAVHLAKQAVHGPWLRAAGAVGCSLLMLVITAGPVRALPADAIAPLEGADPVLFPVSPSLHVATHFWRRVYTEIGTDEGFLHDSRHLDVVYEVLPLDDTTSRRARRQVLRKRIAHYRRILERLAGGRRDGLDDEEARVLDLWPGDVSNATLAEAARSIRFQRGQSDRFLAGLERAGAWLDYIEQVFEREGLPGELALLPHVESSFNPGARSHASAVGMWQFTRSTGRRFMHVDHVVDERLDPFLASGAAARLLAENFEDLGHWPLALTAYNHGVAGMQRAVDTLGTTDMGEIAERYRGRTFGFASRNFYPSFIAAVHVHRHAEQYFGEFSPHAPIDYRHVVMGDYVPAAAVAAALGTTTSTLEALNPALRWPVWRGDKRIPAGYALRLPDGFDQATALASLAALPEGQRFAYQTPDYSHRVERGESLSVIAARYGVSARAIADLNDLRSPYLIRIGQELRLPVRRPGNTAMDDGAVAASAATAAEGAIMTAPGAAYRVRRGDSLSEIARRHRISTQALVAANELVDAHTIREGQMLVIPGVDEDFEPFVPDVYTVRRGDSVWELARRFRIADNQIAALNGLGESGRIYVGQQLRLRPAQEEAAAGN